MNKQERTDLLRIKKIIKEDIVSLTDLASNDELLLGIVNDLKDVLYSLNTIGR